jgi:catechol 2,3-dioxygenase-like lactoylglutathione lyase family enzyme
MGFDGGIVELTGAPGALGQPAQDVEQMRPGLWHIGLRVPAVDPIAGRLAEAGTKFYIEPGFNPEARVRMTFFYDPDGLVIELVEGTLHYTEEYDHALATKQRALPLGPAPRFDHVAISVANWAAAKNSWQALGYRSIGQLKLVDDPNGAVLYFLGDGSDVVVEVFTYATQLLSATPPALRGLAGPLSDAAAAHLLSGQA